MSKRVRGKNFEEDEAADLLNIVVEYKHVLENKKTNAVTNADKIQAWKNITQKFNMSHPLNMRNSEQLTAKYENLKNKARKYAATSTEYKATGGGFTIHKKDPVLDMVVDILNKKTVYGESKDFDDNFNKDLPNSHYEINERGESGVTKKVSAPTQKAIVETMEREKTVLICDDLNLITPAALAASQINNNKTTECSTQKIATNSKNRKLAKMGNDLEKLAESKTEYYKQKARFYEMECNLKQKDIEYRDVQIQLLKEELEQKKTKF